MNIVFVVEVWVVAVVLALLLLLFAEVSFRFGRRDADRTDAGARSQFTAVEAAVLALLGLFLAFSFSAADDRYDTRRKLVLKEANAIGTASLRSQLLPPAQRSEARDLFRRYVDARVEFYDAGLDQARLQTALDDAQSLQRALWSLAVAEMRADVRVHNSLILQSLNDVIDVSSERRAAERYVPAAIFWLLVIIACMAMGTVGYAFGLGKRRHFAILLLALLITAIISLIVDLDRPRRGLVRISQQSLRDLQQTLSEPPAEVSESPGASLRREQESASSMAHPRTDR